MKVTDATTGDPVPGQVAFNLTSDVVGSGPIALDVTGSAHITEPASASGYDLAVTYQGNASYGAEQLVTRIDVS